MTSGGAHRDAFARRGCRLAVCAAVLVASGAVGLAADAAAEQASAPASPAAAGLDAGGFHSCALVTASALRCWGLGADGQLGYGASDAVGDDETPAAAGPVHVSGHDVTAVAAGGGHTCALLDDATVRCWGFGAQGRLGYANEATVTDPAAVGPVDLGTGRTAIAISAGDAHTCALLDDATVRCWGFGGTGAAATFAPDGRLGYANVSNIGDDETPGSVGPVALGEPATAISAGGDHTCALLADGSVRCWGVGSSGQLGYGNRNSIGDDETPVSVVLPVQLGGPAKAITAGGEHSCALLVDGSVRCWGDGAAGQLGYGNRNNIGDDETPVTVGPVDLSGLRAVAISAGTAHTCAVLEDGSVRCWGLGASGRLGYRNQHNIGDDETPASAGPVDLGGLGAVAVSAGRDHSCTRLDNNGVRCWGAGASGRLGYCNEDNIGDDEGPGAAGPVELQSGDGGVRCPSLASPILGLGANVPPASTPPPGSPRAPAARADPSAARTLALRRCFAAVPRRARADARRSGRALSLARTRADRRCLRLYGRTPGLVTGVRARARGATHIQITFTAPGTDGRRAPAARSYVVAQSRRPIRSIRDFDSAQTLCRGTCRLSVTDVGDEASLIVSDLRPRTTYYYAIAARDNVSDRCGPRSKTVSATTGDVTPEETQPLPGNAEPPPPAVRERHAPSCRALR